MNNKDAFSLTKLSGEQRVAAVAYNADKRVQKSHGLLIIILAVVTLVSGIWMYAAGVPLRWPFLSIGVVIFTYKVCRIGIERRAGRPLKLWAKIFAIVYVAGFIAGTVYLYRQMAEIQRIFELT